VTVEADIGVRLGRLDLRVELQVDDREVLALVGPNGAGKTTVLGALSGLRPIDRGRIVIDGATVDDPATSAFVLPEDRPVGMVFQDHLLFPHLSVIDNVAFGPRARGVGRREARQIARGWVDRVGLADHGSARPSAISGGQAQRAALARALATGPRLLLLDEPMAALDATTRPAVRRDLRHHLGDFTGATVLVTHDPLDALALADRVAVLESGTITQQGSIAEVTSRPRTPFVADLLGVNLLRGPGTGHQVRLHGGATVTTADPVSGPTLVLIRPQAVALHRERPDTSARNVWHCRITGFDLLGDHVRVRLGGDVDIVADVTPAAVASLGLADGDQVWAAVKATEVTVYPE
jgi:molybdate transport system ATP-binding protein